MRGLPESYHGPPAACKRKREAGAARVYGVFAARAARRAPSFFQNACRSFAKRSSRCVSEPFAPISKAAAAPDRRAAVEEEHRPVRERVVAVHVVVRGLVERMAVREEKPQHELAPLRVGEPPRERLEPLGVVLVLRRLPRVAPLRLVRLEDLGRALVEPEGRVRAVPRGEEVLVEALVADRAVHVDRPVALDGADHEFAAPAVKDAGRARGVEEGGGVGRKDAITHGWRHGVFQYQRVEQGGAHEDAVVKLGHGGRQRHLAQLMAVEEDTLTQLCHVSGKDKTLKARLREQVGAGDAQLLRQVAVGEVRAAEDDPFAQVLQVVGEDDGVERIAALEGIVGDAVERSGQDDALEILAMVEAGVADETEAVGEGHRCERRIAPECILFNGTQR